MTRAASRSLSPQDSAFLALERAGAPMNIGIVAIFDASAERHASSRPAAPGRIEGLVTERLHALDAAGWRVQRRALWEQHAWIEGAPPALRPVNLPPDGEAALFEWFGGELGRAFEPGDALWRGWVVRGFARDQFAVALKAHHALVDGVGGLAWWRRLFDGQIGAPAERTRASRQGGASRPARGVARILAAALRSGRATPLNGPLGPERCLTTLALPLDLLRALQRRGAGSINDIVLALIGASLDEVLGDGPAARPLRALYPVDRRSGKMAAGNQLGGVLVELGTGTSMDERLSSIRNETRSSRRAAHSQGVEALGRAATWLPARATPLIFSIAGRKRVFNLVCSALRGPSGGTLDGVPLRSVFAFGPLFPRTRCNITVLRGAHELNFGITSSQIPRAVLSAFSETLVTRANTWAAAGDPSIAVEAG